MKNNEVIVTTEDGHVFINMSLVFPTKIPIMHYTLGIHVVGFHGINGIYTILDNALKIFRIESDESRPGTWKNYHTEMLKFFRQVKAGKVDIDNFSFPDSLISATVDLWEAFDPSESEKKKIRDWRMKIKTRKSHNRDTRNKI